MAKNDSGGKKSQPKCSALPKNWPPDVQYTSTPTYSPFLTRAHMRALRIKSIDNSDPSLSTSSSALRDPKPPCQPQVQTQPQPHPQPPPPSSFPTITLAPGPNPSVRIQPISNRSHPAHGQHGLFALRNFSPGEPILLYAGEIHPEILPPDKNPHASSDYDLWLDRDADLAIDAARSGNEARFVNDYRGVPEGNEGGKGRRKPNAEFRTVWDGRRGEVAMAVWVLPVGRKIRMREGKGVGGIRKGEEILVSYGKGFWNKRKEEDEEKKQEEKQGKGELECGK